MGFIVEHDTYGICFAYADLDIEQRVQVQGLQLKGSFESDRILSHIAYAVIIIRLHPTGYVQCAGQRISRVSPQLGVCLSRLCKDLCTESARVSASCKDNFVHDILCK